METVLSVLISVGIIAFGAWIVASAVAAGSAFAWILIVLLPVIVGSLSLHEPIRNARTA